MQPSDCQHAAPISVSRVEAPLLSRYDLFNPFVNCSAGNLTRLGNGTDGSKFICNDRYLNEPGCVVYSLGSFGNYQFEEATLKVRRSVGKPRER